jgi:hypothetical protein
VRRARFLCAFTSPPVSYAPGDLKRTTYKPGDTDLCVSGEEPQVCVVFPAPRERGLAAPLRSVRAPSKPCVSYCGGLIL